MFKLKVHLTENKRDLTSKAGKDFTLVESFVFLPNSPYPEKISFFDVGLAAGVYQVPAKIEVYNGRLTVALDFKAAVQAEK